MLTFPKLTDRTGFSPRFKALQIQLKLLLEHIADKRIGRNIVLLSSLQKGAQTAFSKLFSKLAYLSDETVWSIYVILFD